MKTELLKSRYPRPDIIHVEERDLIVNRSLEQPEDASNLLPVVWNGIPATWICYLPWSEEINEDRPHDNHLYVNSLDNPQYLAKVRQYTDWRTNAKPNDSAQFHAQTRAMSSVLSETHLSPIVRDILKTPKANRIAKKYGFRNLAFVEPLVSQINRETRQKTTYYNFIRGDILLAENDTILNHLSNNHNEEVDQSFMRLFAEYGIYAGDFGIVQFIVPKPEDAHSGTLFMVDIEGFCPLFQSV